MPVGDNVEIDTWYAYECSNCYVTLGASGVVFHLRLAGPCRTPLPNAHCPVCLVRCPCKGTWDADENGFSEPAMPETDSDLDRLANEISDLATRIATRTASALGLVKRYRDVWRLYGAERKRDPDPPCR